jgi:aryl-alcohol dehydrogenase-like predicted oxidoreductase
LLTGQFTPTSEIAGVRRNDPEFQGQRYARNLRLVAKVGEIAAGYGKSAAQLALRWLIDREGVTSVIMGAKRPSQVVENINCLDFEITADDLVLLNALPELDSLPEVE